METAYEIVSITKELSLHFVFIPDGYELKKFELSEHSTKKISRLKDLNRVKMLNHWKKENGCLVKAFEEILKRRNWNFDKFPNPMVFLAKLN